MTIFWTNVFRFSRRVLVGRRENRGPKYDYSITSLDSLTKRFQNWRSCMKRVMNTLIIQERQFGHS